MSGKESLAAELIAPLRKCVRMIAPALRKRLLLAAPLNVLVALLESASAGTIYLLVKVVSEPESFASLPLASWLMPLVPANDSKALILAITGLIAAFYVLKVGVTIWATYTARSAQHLAASEVAARCFRAYLTVPYAFHLRRNSADIATFVNRVIPETIDRTVAAYITLFLEAVVTGGLVIAMMTAAPLVTFTMCALAALSLYGLLRATNRRITASGAQTDALFKQQARHVAHALGALKEVKVLAREAKFLREHDRIVEGLREGLLQRSIVEALPRVVVEAVFVLSGLVAIVLYVAFNERSADVVPLLGLYAYAAFRLIPTSNRVALAIGEIRWRRAALDRVYEDYVALMASCASASKSDANDDGSTYSLTEQIELRDVGFAYGSDSPFALRHVSLTIKRGESYGIVGPTGAGKSTVVDLLLGLLTLSEGQITVDGHPLEALGARFRRSIGYVPQSIFLADDSIRQNVAIGLPREQIDDARVWAALSMAQLDEFVRTLRDGLETEVGERGVRLSGGQRQRIGIARALYHDPAVLVFDEATSALDTATEAEVSRAIESLLGTKTIVIIAHRLSTVQHCDRLFFLVDGQLEASGSYAQLVQDAPLFRRMALSPE